MSDARSRGRLRRDVTCGLAAPYHPSRFFERDGTTPTFRRLSRELRCYHDGLCDGVEIASVEDILRAIRGTQPISRRLRSNVVNHIRMMSARGKSDISLSYSRSVVEAATDVDAVLPRHVRDRDRDPRRRPTESRAPGGGGGGRDRNKSVRSSSRLRVKRRRTTRAQSLERARQAGAPVGETGWERG